MAFGQKRPEESEARVHGNPRPEQRWVKGRCTTSQDPRNIQGLRKARRPESKYMPTRTAIGLEVLSQDMVKGWGLCSFFFLPPILYVPQICPLLFFYGYSKPASLLRSASHPFHSTKHPLPSQSHSYSSFLWLMLFTICATHLGLNLMVSFDIFRTVVSMCLASPDQVISSLK